MSKNKGVRLQRHLFNTELFYLQRTQYGGTQLSACVGMVNAHIIHS